jgi:hypothetical protein
VENRERRLIFLLERAGKWKARILKEKVVTIPETGKEPALDVVEAVPPAKTRNHDQALFTEPRQNIATINRSVIPNVVEEPAFADASRKADRRGARGWARPLAQPYLSKALSNAENVCGAVASVLLADVRSLSA